MADEGSDTFLKIDGIDGESKAKGHDKGDIHLESWRWTSRNTGGMGTVQSTCGKGTFDEMTFRFATCKASPKFFLWCAKGTHIAQAIVSCRKSGGTDQLDYLNITLKHVFVTSYSTDGVIDSINLGFNAVEFKYTPQGADAKGASPVIHKYDLTLTDGS